MTTFTNKELIKEIKERISSLEVRDDIERRAYEISGIAGRGAGGMAAFRQWLRYSGNNQEQKHC